MWEWWRRDAIQLGRKRCRLRVSWVPVILPKSSHPARTVRASVGPRWPGDIFSKFACRLWRRTLVLGRKTRPRDRDSCVRQAPAWGGTNYVLTPLHFLILGSDGTPRRRLTADEWMRVHILGQLTVTVSRRKPDFVEYGFTFVRRCSELMARIYVSQATFRLNSYWHRYLCGYPMKSAQWRGIMTYVARISEGRSKVGVRGEPGEVLLFLCIVQKRADYCR